jgi:hypothetical protein
MVCLIVNGFAYRVRTNGILESSSVAFGDETLSEMTISNNWQERTPELTNLSGADQSLIYGNLLQLGTSLPKFGEKQPQREWVKPVIYNESTPMK